MSKLIWQPSAERVEKANMTRFINYVNQEYHLKMGSYDELYEWSIEKTPDFWASVQGFTEIQASPKYDQVVDDLNKFPGANHRGARHTVHPEYEESGNSRGQYHKWPTGIKSGRSD